jgi:hypothetical protein
MYEALILKEIFELLESKAKVPPEWVAYLQEKLPAISPTKEEPKILFSYESEIILNCL